VKHLIGHHLLCAKVLKFFQSASQTHQSVTKKSQGIPIKILQKSQGRNLSFLDGYFLRQLPIFSDIIECFLR
jgi:hypothetical protein